MTLLAVRKAAKDGRQDRGHHDSFLIRKNNNHSFVFALGKGKGLGRIENVRWSWRKLKKRLSEPLVDTSCTYAQYEAMKQDEKLAKKRAPGSWTPSRYKGNRRAVADLREKTLIVYDLDYILHDQLALICAGLTPISDYAWYMHTTRSHTPESPRVRMILPVSRPMEPDEAHAVFRLLALGLADDPEEAIEIPDLVSFRGNQTMFWPSRSKDQEFWTDENGNAPILDVDAFLAEHPGWENFENLPFQVEESKHGKTDPNKRMEDPYEKLEPIGAFCRCYTVQEVIAEWLSDVYEPCDAAGSQERYTYLLGTASSGAVVYEGGKFLHSNHGSDPVETANAFDLLRLHKFGHLDAACDPDMPPGKRPSYKAMVEFANKDERVINELFSGFDDTLDDIEDADEDEEPPAKAKKQADKVAPERSKAKESDDLGDRLDDLDDEDEDDEPVAKKPKSDQAWRANFRTKANGDLEPVLNNIALIVANDKRVKPSVGYNEFTFDPVCFKPIKAPKIDTPSSPVSRRDRKQGRRWEDTDDIAIQLIASANAERNGYACDFSNDKVQAAVIAAGKQNPIHPVKEDIEDCWRRWKAAGSPVGLLDTWTIQFLGVPDTPFHRQSGALYIVASIARTYEPGCKMDWMPVIEGRTGGGKSAVYKIIFGDEFTTELKAELHDTGRVIEQLRGKRCLEMAEMAIAKRADANTLKSQLSSDRDVHRLAYGKREMDYPRQSVFGGTSNDDDYLTDPTSTRRFHVWRTPKDEFNRIDFAALEAARYLIWGEACQRYLDWREAQPHGALWLDLRDEDVIRERDTIADASRKRTATEIIAEEIAAWLARPVEAGDAGTGTDPLAPDERIGKTHLLVRNMVTANIAFIMLKNDPILSTFRNASTETFGKALHKVPGWRCLGKVRRHGEQPTVWFARGEDGPEWVPYTGEDTEIDDLLG